MRKLPKGQSNLDKTFEKLLAKKLELSPHQMTAEEYRYIGSFLGNVNFLVFGTGHDTPLWRYANKGGLTVFLENNRKWIKKEDTDVYKVTYTTKRAEQEKLLEEYHNGIFDNLKMTLPDVVTNTKWDVIFVDSPVGTNDKKPGRMQSIFTASILANKDTEVFVHDCDRKVEDTYSKAMFSKTVKELSKLRHVVHERV